MVTEMAQKLSVTIEACQEELERVTSELDEQTEAQRNALVDSSWAEQNKDGVGMKRAAAREEAARRNRVQLEQQRKALEDLLVKLQQVAHQVRHEVGEIVPAGGARELLY